jgi:predicted TIM-barrel fold metal-dependent hydrolase
MRTTPRLPLFGLLLACLLTCASCSTAGHGPPSSRPHGDEAAPYAMEDYARVRKFDAHVHANVVPSALLDQARADGFELLSLNVDYPEFPSPALQREAALALARQDPTHFHWAAAFSMRGFGTPDWAEKAGADLAEAKAAGARAVKIWKNVGMAVRDPAGKRVMLDDPRIAPVAARIQALGLPVVGHLGEPRNCWLPLEQMTTDNDREYFRNHPQYYMYLHPEAPSYEEQLAARDRFLDAHPQLRFVGAHLASLEWSADRLAQFLDRYPQASVDLAARMSELQYQSLRDREKVRNFFIRYQDRLLYGTDLTQDPGNAEDPEATRQEAHRVWTSDWRYLATPASQHIEFLHADVPGLALPREVIDKLYYGNAIRVFDVGRTR